MFLLVLLSFVRNSLALDEGMATEDFEGAVPAPATEWKHIQATKWRGILQTLFTLLLDFPLIFTIFYEG